MIRLLLALVAGIFFFQNAGAQNSLSEIYLGSREGDSASIVEDMSVIHGDYTQVEVDLTVTSTDSLVLSRFYSSRDSIRIASFGGWRFNPHCFLTMQKAPKGDAYTSSEGTFERTDVTVGNPDGAILTYVGWRNSANSTNRVLFSIDPEEESIGLANTAKGEISARTNLKNNELYFNPKTDSFELNLCNKGRRFYTKHHSFDTYCITHEILPSGNKIFYEFNDKRQLTFIRETNASEHKVLAWIKIEYGKGVHVETSDGKTAEYQFQVDPSGAELLTTVHRSNKPDLRYSYLVADHRVLLAEKTLPEGRFVHVEYYTDGAHKHKVRSVTTPAGPTETMSTQFIYGDECTEVHGPGSRKTVYRFDEDLQLIAIEQYLDESLYRVQKKHWGTQSDAGNLIATSVEDGGGNVFYYKSFVYDRTNKGNIVEKREYGDVVGTGATPLILDEEGCVTNQDGHIKYYSYFTGKETYGCFQRDAKRTGVKFWYKKGTNLLIKKFLLTNGSVDSEDENYCSGIQQRYFYTYNEDAALIRVIVDDGGEEGPENFYRVRERTIANISPKQNLPNVGVPEVIEQKCSASKGKSEFLLKRIVKQFDAQGNSVSQAIYDANGTHRYSVVKRYAQGLLVFETDPMGNETEYTYDANRNLVLEKHLDTGISIEYGYDVRNRQISTTEKDKSGHQFESHVSYDPSGYKNSEVDRFGNETLYVNDSLGRPLSVTYPQSSNGLHSSTNSTYTYIYDLFDNPISVIDPQGRVLAKSYNVKGQPIEINHLDGTKEAFRYDSAGSVHQHFRRDGLLEVFAYDYMGRPKKVDYYKQGSKGAEYPFKNISVHYTSFHKTSKTDGCGNKTTYTHDGAGRLQNLKKGYQKTEFFYDPLGRTHAVKKWKSLNTFTLEVKEYDLLDRVVEESTEDDTGQVLVKKRYLYNDAGCLAQVIGYPQNKESVLMCYDYDGFGRLCKTINAAGHSTRILYDDAYVDDWGQKGRKRTVIDPSGNQTEEIFDSDEHLVKVTKKDASGQLLSSLETAYDCTGNKVLERARTIQANEATGHFGIEYVYNTKDQLESIILGKGTSKERITGFEYNAYGDLVSKYAPGFQDPIAYHYDNKGNLETISYKEGKKETQFKLFYDLNQNLTRMKRGSDFSLSYTYDYNDQLLSETIEDAFGSYQVNRIYDGEGNIQTLQFPDGSFVEYTYEGPFVKTVSRFSKEKQNLYTHKIVSRDLMGNILEERLPGNLGGRSQRWNETGRRVEITTDFLSDKIIDGGYDSLDNIKNRETALGKKKIITDYEYNALDQLVSEIGDKEHTYSYDSLGNRLQKDGVCYTVNELNQLIEAEGASYTFHLTGTIATKETGAGTWTYRINPLNQIVLLTAPDQYTVTFTYDLTGKRLSKRVEDKEKKGQTFRFFYLGDTEIGCVNEKGVITQLKIPSDPNNPEAPSVAMEIKKETYVPLYDLQGNVACLLDPKGRKVVESYRYSIYGEEEIINKRGRVVSASSVNNPWRYRGKRVDKESGLIYFGYRYYDPRLGRWMSPDLVGTVDGPNLYAFVRNNPIKYVDYFGFVSETNVSQNCSCGYCERGEGFCHCMGSDPTCDADSCACRGISCNHKNSRSIIKIGSNIQKNLFFAGPNFATAGIGDLFQTRSAPYEVGAKDLAYGGIGFINGINNSLDDAQGHALMLSRYAQGAKIQGIYNASHHVFVDVLECIAAHCGVQMPPVQLLKNQWNHFISTHASSTKFLQICHSGGAIHVLNGLLTSPKSVREKIIVLSISPGVIIPNHLCFRSDNYASTRDFVPRLDIIGKFYYGDQLTVLKSHKNALLLDHGIDSPTFQKVIKDNILDYLMQFGSNR